MGLSKYAIENKLSGKQESILCAIQKATYEKDKMFLSMLPEEVVTTANNAQKYWNKGNSEKGKELDLKLVELVKKYWDKKGIAISRAKNDS